MQSKVQLTYVDNMHCETSLPGGLGQLPIDPAFRRGQPGQGPCPLDLLALAQGSCMAMMLSKAAKERGLDVRGTTVEVTHTYTETIPAKLATARLRFVLPRAFTADELAALKAGAELCPVHQSLNAQVEVQMEVP